MPLGIIEKIPNNISKIFIAEYNPNFGYNKKITVPYINKFNRTEYHYSNLCYGMSLPALVDIMKKKNFTFVGSNIACHNAFFVSNNLISKINLKLPSENNLKEYVENNFRESRSKNSKLSFLSGEDKLKIISNCEVIDLSVSKDKRDLIKILGRGELKTKVNITAHGFSAKAKSTIEDLGGKAALIEQKKEKVE